MKNTTFLVLLSLIFCYPGKAAAQTAAAPSAARLNHISDLDKSESFYQGLFSLRKIEEPFKDGKHVWFSLGGAGQMHLIKGETARREHDKNEHLCFSVAVIDEFIAKLNQRHIEYTNWAGTAKAPTIRVDGVKQVYFQDPDGHWLEVNDAP
jgi:lactoylglutathione lyase